ncbi:Na+/H+ antiporter subunit C [Oharaeibacter diazotrophicus]|uniref:Multicomponent Na+:H+ antiporter subunit C n=1 Tax=Oharaeibacter diazotrophicus TaxID=1920512 RepID=A0A4R6RC54_9HYPH|nr:Na+/H+ antiporter subunit C [Oharaeibacter diazotrophicus]TDP83246.1 multicomponent Na+:H+ antiporter subunit C [Oharaeibacter diazotrophicus]BBE72079.1 Na(+)/H(+) antiporter subunit C [Pleomorphomonas sp. SM30]GLS78844.1 cation:proton antiporter [Oharaeibacter diazotrophicus]
MEPLFAILVGAFYAAAVYLLLSRKIVRILIGVALLGNAVNLTLFVAGRLTREAAPLIAPDADVPAGPVANALPQALILTAIVISFSFFAFLLVLAFRAYQDLGTDDVDAMRVAEPVGPGRPPEGY